LAQTLSVLIYTHVDVVVAGKFQGSGSAWGIGSGVSNLAGTMFYDSEDTLSAENDFHMVIFSIGAGGAGIAFVIDSNAVDFFAELFRDYFLLSATLQERLKLCTSSTHFVTMLLHPKMHQ